MIELTYLGAGLLAGIIAGYIGLGGGVIMVPYLTLLVGLDIKTAVPISVTAIAANSIAVSTEYLKKGLVDLNIVAKLALFLILGFLTGSSITEFIPDNYIKILFAILLLYTAYNLGFKKPPTKPDSLDSFKPLGALTMFLSFVTGIIAALLGLGGGVIMVPVLFLMGHQTLTQARGTWAFTYGFASVAALILFLIQGRLELQLVSPVVAGILIGGRIGGLLGTTAKPKVVKIVFMLLLLYTAFKLGYPSLKELL